MQPASPTDRAQDTALQLRPQSGEHFPESSKLSLPLSPFCPNSTCPCSRLMSQMAESSIANAGKGAGAAQGKERGTGMLAVLGLGLCLSSGGRG